MQKPTTVRIPESTRAAIEDLVQQTGRPFSRVVNEMLEEAIRIRRIPGIAFADGPTGRRARIAGTGVDVFEVIQTFRQLGQDWQKLQKAYDWLSETQLRAALAYTEAYPDEIGKRLEQEARWSAEETAHRYPFTVPR